MRAPISPAAKRLRVDAPAKVNLGLRIVGRRADGYHLLDSLMVPVSFGDTVEIGADARAGDIHLECSEAELPAGEDNLAWRAAALMRRRLRRQGGVRLRLQKRIPAGAGLGGGSADAAAVLVGLDAMWGTRLSLAALADLGAELGADVPFAVHCRPAVVRGIGEQLTPLRGFRRRWLVLVWPGFPISTAWAYGQLRRSLTNAVPAPMILPSARGRRALRSILWNDLEAVATAAYPEIVSIKERILALGAEGALMSGSGSACFGLFGEASQAARAAAALRRSGLWAEAVHTIERRPPFRVR